MSQPRVLLVTSESVPLVKTGGLADVIGALAGSLAALRVDTTIMMPAYPAALAGARQLVKIADLTDLPGGNAELLQGRMPDTGVKLLLVRSPLFDRRSANPYIDKDGNELDDNAVAFADLAHAAVRVCAGKTPYPVPHVVQANDWHAGLIPALLKLQNIHNVGSVLTIHNLAFQGNFPLDQAARIGIPTDMLTEDGMKFWGKMSYLKAGIAWADAITTVSKTYAQEILGELGYGMQDILNRRRHVLSAIPNGVDLSVWNPGSDRNIKRNFSLDHMSGKAVCKRELQRLFQLPLQPFAPLLALGSRITHQKMADVVLDALPQLLEQHPHLQIVVHGCGEPQYEERFLQLAAAHPQQVGVHIGYDEQRAHALHAGADILLHPTRFEPFGLTPIYAMLYGTIPVASGVGGLCDTIIDAGAGTDIKAGANGILYTGEQAIDLEQAVNRTLSLYAQPSSWSSMQRNAMAGDYSWNGPAAAYTRLYAHIAPAHTRALFRDLLKPKHKTPLVQPSLMQMTA